MHKTLKAASVVTVLLIALVAIAALAQEKEKQAGCAAHAAVSAKQAAATSAGAKGCAGMHGAAAADAKMVPAVEADVSTDAPAGCMHGKTAGAQAGAAAASAGCGMKGEKAAAAAMAGCGGKDGAASAAMANGCMPGGMGAMAGGGCGMRGAAMANGCMPGGMGAMAGGGCGMRGAAMANGCMPGGMGAMAGGGCGMMGAVGAGMPGQPMPGLGMGEDLDLQHIAMALHQLDLTPEQQKKIRGLHEASARVAIQAQADVRLARLDLDQMLHAEKPEKARIEAQIDKVARLQAGLAKNRIGTLLEVFSILTPEQRTHWQAMQMPGDDE